MSVQGRAIASAVAYLLGASCTPKSASPPWHVVFSDLPTPVMSAWESQDGILYVVGGNARRSLVLRHDTEGWWEMDPGTNHALWWVFGFSSTNVYAVGEGGTITYFLGTSWQVLPTSGPFTLWGVWGSTPDDLWAVGGDPTLTNPGPVVVRGGPQFFQPFSTGVRTDANLFKVWGSSSSDVFAVGDRGAIEHFDGNGFTLQTAPTTDRLVTVFGSGAGDVYAVGGLAGPVVLHYDGTTWSSRAGTGSLSQNLFGGARGAGTEAVYVGWSGLVAEDDGHTVSEVSPLTSDCLHGATLTTDGFVAAGGDMTGALTHGTLLARGNLDPGPLQPWPHPGLPLGDAGHTDAGATDAGSAWDGGGDGGAVGPGAICTSQPLPCDGQDSCWLINLAHEGICTRNCGTAADCGAFGAGPCCLVPGPQTTQTVCIPAGVGPCSPDAGADGG